jgi:asparagine synthase (glutamine-hydrolysing)
VCGITGFWRPAGLPDGAESLLGSMMKTLDHRGPDGTGHHLDPARGLAMGHTRLSIIDLQGGHQPLHARDGRITLTVNGEFYDYKRIRARLACDGERFGTKSDSEIAIPLYRRHGLAFVEHLRGEFAFALYDQERERLILVRDRFGIKPLYYRLQDDELIWGSEVKAILQHPGVPHRLDRKAAVHQVMQVMVPGSTAYEGVEGLLPGHMLIVERKGDRLEARTQQYWDFEFPDAVEHGTREHAEALADEYVAGVRERLIDAVATRLEADVPVGCYLSGGIDSCSILGLATPMQQSHVKAFTIAFDHADYDESAIAREMAERTEADQEMLLLSADELYGDAFLTTVRHAERTFYNTLAVAKWHMSRRVRECGYKVVITGEGSDELFGGYPFYKRDYFLHAPDEAGANDPTSSAGVFHGAILAEEQQSHAAWNDLCGFTPSWIQPWMITLEAARPLFSAEVTEMLRDYDPVAAVAGAIDPAKVRGRHVMDIAQYTWSKTMLEGQILTWGGDRVDMANSMESRPAFLDHHLAEYAATIPPCLRIRGGIEKWVLREAMRGVLPDVLYHREKFAFMAPPSGTDRDKHDAIGSLARHWLDPDRVAEVGLFDPARVRDFVDGTASVSDPVLARRSDILLNHLVQLHVLAEAPTGEPSPVPALG